MNPRIPLVLALAPTLALAACATMDRDDCLAADWRTLGVEDGARGHMVSNIRQYREACADYGVRPNLEEYQAGHAMGARSFCTPTNGFSKGRAGADGYEAFCPPEVTATFVAAYQRGRAVYSAEQRLQRERQALEQIVTELDAIDDTILDYTARVAADATPVAERVKLVKELVELADRRSDLGLERPARERAAAAAEVAVARALRDAGL